MRHLLRHIGDLLGEPSPGQQLDDGGVQRGVSRRHDPSAAGRRSAFPGRDAPASAFDDRNEGDDIVRFQAGLDDEVDVTAGQETVAVAIAAVAGEACARCDRIEFLAVGVAEQVGAGGRENAFGKPLTGARPYPARRGRRRYASARRCAPTTRVPR